MRKILVAAAVLAFAQAATAADISWANPAGGSYHVGSNWSSGTVPGGADNVFFAPSAANSATISLGTHTIARTVSFAGSDTRMELGAFFFNAPTINVAGQLPASATLANGTINIVSGIAIGEDPSLSSSNLTLSNVRGTVSGLPGVVSIGVNGPGGTLTITNDSSLSTGGILLGPKPLVPAPPVYLVIEDNSTLLSSIQPNNAVVEIRTGGKLHAGTFHNSIPDFLDSMTINVDGKGSELRLDYYITICAVYQGSMSVTNGGRVVLAGPVSDAFDGILNIAMAAGEGTVTVDGAGSVIDLAAQMSVGRRGVGTLIVTNKGAVVSRPNPFNVTFAGAGVIARDTGGVGTVVIDGSGSRWDALGDVWVGGAGFGTLSIQNEGHVNAENLKVAAGSTGFGYLQVISEGSLIVSDTLVVGPSTSFFGGQIGFMSVFSGGYASVGRETRINETGVLTIGVQGRLDITSGALLHDYDITDPSTALTAQVTSGYAGGAWNGSGIVSSAARDDGRLGIAIADVSAWPFATFAGEALDPTGVLLRVTYKGDADANLTVDIGDFALLAANFNQPGVWRSGDFDYNGVTNFADFAAMAANFGRTYAPESRSVPEPNVGSIVGLTIARSSLRRRRSC